MSAYPLQNCSFIPAMKESGDENAEQLIEHCLNEIKSMDADAFRNLCDFAEFLVPIAPERVASIIDELSECTMLCDLYHDIPARLVSYMAPKDPAMALELAKKVKEEKRDITLVDACYHLLDSIKDRAPRNALIIAREIKDRRLRDECLESVASELAGEDAAIALKIAEEISYEYGKEMVYLAIIENAPEERYKEVISLTDRIENPELRSRALLALAKMQNDEKTSMQLVDDAKKLAGQVMEECRDALMMDLALTAARFSPEKGISLALESKDMERKNAIIQIFRMSTRNGDRVMELVKTLPDPHLRATALLAIADELMKINVERALEKIDDEELLSMVRDNWSTRKLTSVLEEKYSS